MNALTLLKKDHDAAKTLVEELAETSERAVKEHHLVDDIVEQLTETPFDDEQWTAKFKVAKENVEHHIEEEGEMFRQVRAHFSEGERMEL